jgi:hypothetical protein
MRDASCRWTEAVGEINNDHQKRTPASGLRPSVDKSCFGGQADHKEDDVMTTDKSISVNL